MVSRSTTLRDVSSPQRLLPIDSARWDTFRLGKRARKVRVGQSVEPKYQASLKTFYLALCMMGTPLVRADQCSFRMRRETLLFDLQMSESTFYRLCRKLREDGLLQTRRHGAASTEYRVFAHRRLAAEYVHADSVKLTESNSVNLTETVTVNLTESLTPTDRPDHAPRAEDVDWGF